MTFDAVRFTRALVEKIKGALAPMESRLVGLEQRVKELEAKPAMKDAGVWSAGRTYGPGDICTHDGGGWICSEAHFSVGTEPDHRRFRLFVKRGRDGRNLR